jgi:hypothetical protein
LTRSPFRIAAIALFAVLIAANFYRAATQSLVHDEALSWELYLSGPVSAIFQTYTANNHFLATILFRVSITLFGNSEFAMRLPSVLAGAWFFWTVFRLCALVLGERWLFLVGCAALALNPILLDFLVAARGYGLAIAGLFWAIYQMLCWVQGREAAVPEDQLRHRLWKAAAGCSIAVASNLTMLMPVALIAAAFCLMLWPMGQPTEPVEPATPVKPRKKKSKPKGERVAANPFGPLLHFIMPVAVMAIAFVIAAPVDVARTSDFYAGSATAMKGLRSVLQVSFAYGSGAAMRRIERIVENFAMFFLPLVVIAAIVVAFAGKRIPRTVAGAAAMLSSLAVIGAALLLLIAHLASGIPYPEDRTGIYFVPLATLAALGLARLLANGPGFLHCAGTAIGIMLAILAVEFAAQWNVNSFWVWRYDADAKRIFEQIETQPRPANAADGSIRLGVSWVFEPALNYYRDVRKAAWMAPVDRDGFDGVRQFYVLTPEDQNSPKLPKIKPIYRGPASGALLAIPQ